MIDRDLGLGLGLGRDRLFGGISVSAEIANFSAENRDKIHSKKSMTFANFRQKIFLIKLFQILIFWGSKFKFTLGFQSPSVYCNLRCVRLENRRGCVIIGNLQAQSRSRFSAEISANFNLGLGLGRTENSLSRSITNMYTI